jgi:hypothetical protein
MTSSAAPPSASRDRRGRTPPRSRSDPGTDLGGAHDSVYGPGWMYVLSGLKTPLETGDSLA